MMDTVDKIKQKIDIVDLVGSYINLKKSGRNYKALCPFHSEDTPSFMVSPELQIFKCFGCSEAGDIFSFHQKIEGTDFVQSLEMLAERAGVEIERKDFDPNREKKKKIYEINEITQKYYSYLLTDHDVGKEALDYLKEKRELKDETIKEFGLGYAPKSWDSLYKYLSKKGYKDEEVYKAGLISKRRKGNGYYDKFRGRVIFPLMGISGKVMGFTGRSVDGENPKYLNTPETSVFHKSIYVYGLDKAKVALKKEGAIFVEGQVDVITAHEAEIKNVVATSGTSLTPGQLKIISRYTNDITFAFDSDEAGINAAHRAVQLAEEQGFNVKVTMLPDKYQDLDEMIKVNKKQAQEKLKNAVPAYDFFLAAALKRNNKNSPIGKRKIMNEIIPLFGRMTDPVLRDHYIKKISGEVGVTEAVVANLLKNKTKERVTEDLSEKELNKLSEEFANQTPEEYILTLLLKASLSVAQTTLYKLGKADFTDENMLKIFIKLKDYLIDRKRKFKIKYFIKRFDDEKFQQMVYDLYLQDLQKVEDDPKLLEEELDRVFDLLKKSRTKRGLKKLSEKIRQAEMAGNKEELEELKLEFKELSQKLL